MVHDGWRATVAVDLEGMGMTRSMVYHAQGEIVVQDLNAPVPEELAYFTTNHIESRWSALKRWLRKRCGGKMPRVDQWGRYIHEYQWRLWEDGPIVPRMIDTIRENSMVQIQIQDDGDRASANEWNTDHPIDLLSSDSSGNNAEPIGDNIAGGQVIDLLSTDLESVESTDSDAILVH